MNISTVITHFLGKSPVQSPLYRKSICACINLFYKGTYTQRETFPEIIGL